MVGNKISHLVRGLADLVSIDTAPPLRAGAIGRRATPGGGRRAPDRLPLSVRTFPIFGIPGVKKWREI